MHVMVWVRDYRQAHRLNRVSNPSVKDVENSAKQPIPSRVVINLVPVILQWDAYTPLYTIGCYCALLAVGLLL